MLRPEIAPEAVRCTGGWNSTLLVFGGILQNTSGDRLGVYEMAFNTTWITITPSAATVPGGITNAVTIHFLPEDLLPDFTYNVNLTIRNSVLDTTIVMPVALTVNNSRSCGSACRHSAAGI